MEIEFTVKAQNDLLFWQKSGQKQIQVKITKLIESVQSCAFKGIGKPEQLKGDFSEYWSRQINKKDRMIYRVIDNTVYIYSLRGHYLDK